MIGVIGIGTSYALLYIFATIFSTTIKNIPINAVAGIINTFINYMMNHYWTFRDKRKGINLGIGGIKFYVTTAISIGIYLIVFWGLNKAGMNPWLSVFVANVISFVPKYAMCYFWVWGTTPFLRFRAVKNGGV